jgi:hypothetical protein
MLCPHLLPPNGKQHTYSKETIALAIAESRQQQEEEGDSDDDEGPPDALLLVLLFLVVRTCSSTRHMR